MPRVTSRRLWSRAARTAACVYRWCSGAVPFRWLVREARGQGHDELAAEGVGEARAVEAGVGRATGLADRVDVEQLGQGVPRPERATEADRVARAGVAHPGSRVRDERRERQRGVAILGRPRDGRRESLLEREVAVERR